jgi:RNA polymerase sigma-70 factor (ECF subfamily)
MKYARREAPETAPPLTGLSSLYAAHAGLVERWATRLSGPGLDTEDVVQEVFMVVQRRLPEWRGDARITSWLYRITERVVHRQRRKQRVRRWLRGLAGDFAADLPADRLSPVEELQRKHTVRTLYRALEALDRKQRAALILFEIDGLSGEEIASLTGAKVATVWVRLHRARAQLLKRLREMGERGEA